MVVEVAEECCAVEACFKEAEKIRRRHYLVRRTGKLSGEGGKEVGDAVSEPRGEEDLFDGFPVARCGGGYFR